MEIDEKYKCGHDRTIIILDCNVLSFIAYDEWRTSTGFDGDKTQCWDCANKEE